MIPRLLARRTSRHRQSHRSQSRPHGHGQRRSGAAAGIGAPGQSSENIDGRHYRTMDGFVAPSDSHIEQVLNFVRGWDRSAPLVVLVTPASAARPQALSPPCVCSSASRRNLDRTTDSRRLPDRVAEPVDREPGGPGFGARWADAARPRRNGSGHLMIEGRPFRLDLD